jgi:hypothetical protein
MRTHCIVPVLQVKFGVWQSVSPVQLVLQTEAPQAKPFGQAVPPVVEHAPALLQVPSHAAPQIVALPG